MKRGMKRGDHKIFLDRKKLAELIRLRKAGWSLRSLAAQYHSKTTEITYTKNFDTKAVRYQLKKHGIQKPEEVYNISEIIRNNLQHFLPKLHSGEYKKLTDFKEVNNQLINKGETPYAERLKEDNQRNKPQ